MSPTDVQNWVFSPSPNTYGKTAVFQDGKLIGEIPPIVAEAIQALQARITVLDARLTSLIQIQERAKTQRGRNEGRKA